MNTDDYLRHIAHELKLIRKALERSSPPPPKEPDDEKEPKERRTAIVW